MTSNKKLLLVLLSSGALGLSSCGLLPTDQIPFSAIVDALTSSASSGEDVTPGTSPNESDSTSGNNSDNTSDSTSGNNSTAETPYSSNMQPGSSSSFTYDNPYSSSTTAFTVNAPTDCDFEFNQEYQEMYFSWNPSSVEYGNRVFAVIKDGDKIISTFDITENQMVSIVQLRLLGEYDVYLYAYNPRADVYSDLSKTKSVLYVEQSGPAAQAPEDFDIQMVSDTEFQVTWDEKSTADADMAVLLITFSNTIFGAMQVNNGEVIDVRTLSLEAATYDVELFCFNGISDSERVTAPTKLVIGDPERPVLFPVIEGENNPELYKPGDCVYVKDPGVEVSKSYYRYNPEKEVNSFNIDFTLPDYNQNHADPMQLFVKGVPFDTTGYPSPFLIVVKMSIECNQSGYITINGQERYVQRGYNNIEVIYEQDITQPSMRIVFGSPIAHDEYFKGEVSFVVNVTEMSHYDPSQPSDDLVAPEFDMWVDKDQIFTYINDNGITVDVNRWFITIYQKGEYVSNLEVFPGCVFTTEEWERMYGSGEFEVVLQYETLKGQVSPSSRPVTIFVEGDSYVDDPTVLSTPTGFRVSLVGDDIDVYWDEESTKGAEGVTLFVKERDSAEEMRMIGGMREPGIFETRGQLDPGIYEFYIRSFNESTGQVSPSINAPGFFYYRAGSPENLPQPILEEVFQDNGVLRIVWNQVYSLYADEVYLKVYKDGMPVGEPLSIDMVSPFITAREWYRKFGRGDFTATIFLKNSQSVSPESEIYFGTFDGYSGQDPAEAPYGIKIDVDEMSQKITIKWDTDLDPNNDIYFFANVFSDEGESLGTFAFKRNLEISLEQWIRKFGSGTFRLYLSFSNGMHGLRTNAISITVPNVPLPDQETIVSAPESFTAEVNTDSDTITFDWDELSTTYATDYILRVYQYGKFITQLQLPASKEIDLSTLRPMLGTGDFEVTLTGGSFFVTSLETEPISIYIPPYVPVPNPAPTGFSCTIVDDSYIVFSWDEADVPVNVSQWVVRIYQYGYPRDPLYISNNQSMSITNLINRYGEGEFEFALVYVDYEGNESAESERKTIELAYPPLPAPTNFRIDVTSSEGSTIITPYWDVESTPGAEFYNLCIMQGDKTVFMEDIMGPGQPVTVPEHVANGVYQVYILAIGYNGNQSELVKAPEDLVIGTGAVEYLDQPTGFYAEATNGSQALLTWDTSSTANAVFYYINVYKDGQAIVTGQQISSEYGPLIDFKEIVEEYGAGDYQIALYVTNGDVTSPESDRCDITFEEYVDPNAPVAPTNIAIEVDQEKRVIVIYLDASATLNLSMINVAVTGTDGDDKGYNFRMYKSGQVITFAEWIDRFGSGTFDLSFYTLNDYGMSNPSESHRITVPDVELPPSTTNPKPAPTDCSVQLIDDLRDPYYQFAWNESSVWSPYLYLHLYKEGKKVTTIGLDGKNTITVYDLVHRYFINPGEYQWSLSAIDDFGESAESALQDIVIPGGQEVEQLQNPNIYIDEKDGSIIIDIGNQPIDIASVWYVDIHNPRGDLINTLTVYPEYPTGLGFPHEYVNNYGEGYYEFKLYYVDHAGVTSSHSVSASVYLAATPTQLSTPTGFNISYDQTQGEMYVSWDSASTIDAEYFTITIEYGSIEYYSDVVDNYSFVNINSLYLEAGVYQVYLQSHTYEGLHSDKVRALSDLYIVGSDDPILLDAPRSLEVYCLDEGTQVLLTWDYYSTNTADRVFVSIYKDRKAVQEGLEIGKNAAETIDVSDIIENYGEGVYEFAIYYEIGGDRSSLSNFASAFIEKKETVTLVAPTNIKVEIEPNKQESIVVTFDDSLTYGIADYYTVIIKQGDIVIASETFSASEAMLDIRQLGLVNGVYQVYLEANSYTLGSSGLVQVDDAFVIGTGEPASLGQVTSFGATVINGCEIEISYDQDEIVDAAVMYMAIYKDGRLVHTERIYRGANLYRAGEAVSKHGEGEYEVAMYCVNGELLSPMSPSVQIYLSDYVNESMPNTPANFAIDQNDETQELTLYWDNDSISNAVFCMVLITDEYGDFVSSLAISKYSGMTFTYSELFRFVNITYGTYRIQAIARGEKGDSSIPTEAVTFTISDSVKVDAEVTQQQAPTGVVISYENDELIIRYSKAENPRAIDMFVNFYQDDKLVGSNLLFEEYVSYTATELSNSLGQGEFEARVVYRNALGESLETDSFIFTIGSSEGDTGGDTGELKAPQNVRVSTDRSGTVLIFEWDVESIDKADQIFLVVEQDGFYVTEITIDWNNGYFEVPMSMITSIYGEGNYSFTMGYVAYGSNSAFSEPVYMDLYY